MFNSVGFLLFQLRSPENASPWLHRALDTLRAHPHGKHQSLEAEVLSNLGEMHAVLGEFAQAVRVNKEASVLYGKMELPSTFLIATQGLIQPLHPFLHYSLCCFWFFFLRQCNILGALSLF